MILVDDVLHRGGSSRLGLGILDHRLDLLAHILVQQIERSNRATVGGNRVLLDPATAGKLEEVIARVDRGVERLFQRLASTLAALGLANRSSRGGGGGGGRRGARTRCDGHAGDKRHQ